MNKWVEDFLFYALGALILLGGFFVSFSPTGFFVLQEFEKSEDVFYSANFKIFINGKQVDFEKQKMEIVSLKNFFESLNMKFDSNCIVLSNGAHFCNKTGKSLKFFVNGVESNEFENFVPKDLDKILISYGDDSAEQLQKQIDSVA